MLFAGAIHQALKDAFEFDAEIGVRAYLSGRSATKWVIAADFVLTGAERVNDAFAFTIQPYELDDFSELLAKSRQAIPADMKRVRRLQAAAAAFLADRSRFHFCFLPTRDRHGLGSREDAQEALADLLDHLRGLPEMPSKPALVRKIEALIQRAKARNFNFALLHNIVFLAAVAGWLAMLIARHSRPEMIMWVFDRDAMTTAFDGIVYDMTFNNFHALCRMEGVGGNRVLLSHATDPDAGDWRGAWFDDLIRAPDYIAGTLARWELGTTEAQPVPGKVADVIDKVIGENPNVVLILVRCGAFGITTARLRAYSKLNANRAAYRHSPTSIADYLGWVCIGKVDSAPSGYRNALASMTALNRVGLKIWWRPVGRP